MVAGGHLALGFKQRAAEGPPGRGAQGHPRLPGRAVALMDVAAQAGRGDVVPTVAAAAAAGDHMIDGEPLTLTAAVLAAVPIAMEHVAAGQGQGPERDPHELPQADHRWQGQTRSELTSRVMFQPLGFSLEDHHTGPPPAGDVQRLVGGVENQNRAHGSAAWGLPDGSSLNWGHARSSFQVCPVAHVA